MIRFSLMNKQEKDAWLPELFDLLYNNMQSIAPHGLGYEREKEEWLANVSPALEKETRQILLCFADQELAGYLQYYTREKLVMVEEVQLKSAYQRTMVFYYLCRALLELMPEEIVIIEAYADKRNVNSQGIMKKLGMQQVGEEGGFVHLRGSVSQAGDWFR